MKYKIIDNFLNKKILEYILSLKFKSIGNKEIIGHHNQIYKNGKFNLSCFDKHNLIEINKFCHEQAIKILRELAPEKERLYEYSDFNIIETGKDYTFPIHRDHINKLLSGVIYLKPERNTGTIIYKNRAGEKPKTINWKTNRAFFFSRTENNSWHNYKGNGLNNRIVLVYNLMTTNTKAVCEIEGLNYIFIRLRETINPILYRFFKKTI